MTTPTAPSGSLWRPSCLLYLVGLVGLLGLIPLLPQLDALLRRNPGLAELPLPILLGASLVQPAVLLLVTVVIGAWLTPKIGLRSHLAAMANGQVDWSGFGRVARTAIATGAVVTIIILVSKRRCWRI